MTNNFHISQSNHMSGMQAMYNHSHLPGKAERGDAHKILGNPTISNEEWGIEVYVRDAKCAEFTAPIPLFGIDKAIVPIIILYDQNHSPRFREGLRCRIRRYHCGASMVIRFGNGQSLCVL
jgi:hypothetical protein